MGDLGLKAPPGCFFVARFVGLGEPEISAWRLANAAWLLLTLGELALGLWLCLLGDDCTISTAPVIARKLLCGSGLDEKGVLPLEHAALCIRNIEGNRRFIVNVQSQNYGTTPIIIPPPARTTTKKNKNHQN